MHTPFTMKTVTKMEAETSWSHFIGLKRLWANIFGTATSFKSRSVRFQRKTLVWYFGEVPDPNISPTPPKNTTVCGMKFEYWCLEGYEVYFNGYCKNSSVHFGTHDLTKLYANLRIFDCKREDLKTSVFRGSLLSSHLTVSNSYIAESEFKPSEPNGMFQLSNFCSYYFNFKSFCTYSMEFFHYALWRQWYYVFILPFLP